MVKVSHQAALPKQLLVATLVSTYGLELGTTNSVVMHMGHAKLNSVLTLWPASAVVTATLEEAILFFDRAGPL